MICNEWTIYLRERMVSNRKVLKVLRTGKLVTKYNFMQMLAVSFSDPASDLQKAICCKLNAVNKVKAVAVLQ